MKKILSTALILLLSGCSVLENLVKSENVQDQTLQNLAPVNVRLMENENINIDHDRVVEKYRAYLDVSTDDELRIRTYHRIANLRLQKDEYVLVKGEVPTGNENQEQTIDFGRDSIADYERLLTKYPDRNDNDLALYQLAKAYSLAGEPFETIRVLEQLTEYYPRSDHYLESLFRLGEVYYANGVYDLAENAYQRLIERGAEENKYFLSAMYLIGWSQFKQNNYEGSLLSFTSVLDFEFPDSDSINNASSGQKGMLNDILRIMAITFDYLGDWKNVDQFYAQIGQRHYEYRIYETLAEQYYDKQYYKSGASTLRAYINRYRKMC